MLPVMPVDAGGGALGGVVRGGSAGGGRAGGGGGRAAMGGLVDPGGLAHAGGRSTVATEAAPSGDVVRFSLPPHAPSTVTASATSPRRIVTHPSVAPIAASARARSE